MKSIGIVIPAYQPNLGQLSSYIRALDDHLSPKEIRIELDNPQSNEITEALNQTVATVSTTQERRGKGAAVTAGFESLSTDIRMFLDADGSTPVESAACVLKPLEDGRADISTGSRRHPDSTTPVHQTVARRYLGDCFAQLARALLPIQLYDYQCGAKAITAEVWEDIRTHLYEEGFAWDLEMLSIADSVGLSVAEVPIIWEDQPGSTVNPLNTVVEFTRALIAVRHRSLVIQGHPIHAAFPPQQSRTLVNDE